MKEFILSGGKVYNGCWGGYKYYAPKRGMIKPPEGFFIRSIPKSNFNILKRKCMIESRAFNH